MPTRRIVRPNLNLKNEIEAEIKADQEADVQLDVALKMLKVKSVDKEFRDLQKRVAATAFAFHARDEKHGLRPYQEETLKNLSRLVKEKAKIIAVQLPTGAGKTFLIHSFIYESMLKKSKNVLVVAPSWEIANQHAATVCQQFKDGTKRVRRLGGRGQLISQFEEFKKGEKGKVIITTCALFYARQIKLREFLKAGLVVIDEGHHGYKKKRLNSIQGFAREMDIPLVLLTATPPQNMQNLPFAAQLKYLDLVPEYLVKCKVIRLETGEEFDPVLKNGILSQSSRVELSSRSQRYGKIVLESEKHRIGQTIYYAGSVSEAMGVLEEYNELAIPAVVVHSKWASKGDKINSLAIERFRSGKAQVLVNVQMLAMGFDVPNVETIIVARPVESDTLFTQMVGRGARPIEGKDKFILIDVHDTIFKPEVSKIFEHRHLFYTGTEVEPVDQELPAAQPVTIITPAVLPLRDPDRFDIMNFEPFDLLAEAERQRAALYKLLEVQKPELSA